MTSVSARPPAGGPAANRWFAEEGLGSISILTCNDASLARRVAEPELLQLLLSLPVGERGRFKAHLRSNRLSIEATPGQADEQGVERFLRLSVLLANCVLR